MFSINPASSTLLYWSWRWNVCVLGFAFHIWLFSCLSREVSNQNCRISAINHALQESSDLFVYYALYYIILLYNSCYLLATGIENICPVDIALCIHTHHESATVLPFKHCYLDYKSWLSVPDWYTYITIGDMYIHHYKWAYCSFCPTFQS